MLNKDNVSKNQITLNKIISNSIDLRFQSSLFLEMLKINHPDFYKNQRSEIDKLIELCKDWSNQFDSYCRQGGV